jgi:hypothetical protein
MRAISVALAAAALAACASSSSDSTRHASGASWRALDGWTAEPGLAGAAPTDLAMAADAEPRSTIVVRAVPRGGDTRRAQDATVEAAALALSRSLPCFTEQAPAARSTTTERLPVVTQRYEFCPPGGSAAARYQRTHAVVTGHTQIFHIIHTAPVGSTVDAGGVASILATFKEGA